jgi:hypothetical protein
MERKPPVMSAISVQVSPATSKAITARRPTPARRSAGGPSAAGRRIRASCSSELRRAHDLAERLVALAEEQGVPLQRALARRARGTALFFLGRFADATAALDDGSAIDDAVAAWEDPAHLLISAERAGVVCRLYSAWALWFLGFPDRALHRVEAGLHPQPKASARF